MCVGEGGREREKGYAPLMVHSGTHVFFTFITKNKDHLVISTIQLYIPRQAVEALLQEARQGRVRADQAGPSGW